MTFPNRKRKYRRHDLYLPQRHTLMRSHTSVNGKSVLYSSHPAAVTDALFLAHLTHFMPPLISSWVWPWFCFACITAAGPGYFPHFIPGSLSSALTSRESYL